MKYSPNWNTTKFFPLVTSLQADALVENGILIRRNKFKIRYTQPLTWKMSKQKWALWFDKLYSLFEPRNYNDYFDMNFIGLLIYCPNK